jgi:hypothetical protein
VIWPALYNLFIYTTKLPVEYEVEAFHSGGTGKTDCLVNDLMVILPLVLVNDVMIIMQMAMHDRAAKRGLDFIEGWVYGEKWT